MKNANDAGDPGRRRRWRSLRRDGAPGARTGRGAAARRRRAAPSRRAARPVAAEGRVVAYPGAEVRVGAERAGRLVRVAGRRRARPCAKGELLAELESDELRAALAEARARVAEAEAEVRLAELNLERRAGPRARSRSWPRHDLDQATRDLDIARARAETAQADGRALRGAAPQDAHRWRPSRARVIARARGRGRDGRGRRPRRHARRPRAGCASRARPTRPTRALALGAPVAITAEGYPGQLLEGPGRGDPRLGHPARGSSRRTRAARPTRASWRSRSPSPSRRR